MFILAAVRVGKHRLHSIHNFIINTSLKKTEGVTDFNKEAPSLVCIIKCTRIIGTLNTRYEIHHTQWTHCT